LTVDADHVDRFRIAYGGEDVVGPDLGFLVLPSVETAALDSKKSFMNLALHRGELLERPPGVADGMWIVWGYPDQLTEARVSERGFSTVKAFRGIGFAVRFERQREVGGFDYIDLGGSITTPPRSFGGCSGGGLWQVSIKRRRTKGKFETDKLWFSGVAFRGSDIFGDHREILCHGRRSIYLTALEAIREGLSRSS